MFSVCTKHEAQGISVTHMLCDPCPLCKAERELKRMGEIEKESAGIRRDQEREIAQLKNQVEDSDKLAKSLLAWMDMNKALIDKLKGV